MKCQVNGCDRDGSNAIGVHVMDTPNELVRLLLPLEAKVCDEHLALLAPMAGIAVRKDPSLGGGLTSGLRCDGCGQWYPTGTGHECLASFR